MRGYNASSKPADERDPYLGAQLTRGLDRRAPRIENERIGSGATC